MKAFSRKYGQKGAVAVEFALVLPVLILLLFGTIEFGLLLYNNQILTNASREGARAGIVLSDPRTSRETITSIVRRYCGGRLITFGADNEPGVDVPDDPLGLSFGDDLTVTVTYNYAFLFLSILEFDPITLEAKTVMKME